MLGELVNAIAQADLSNMLRRQVVCTVEPGGPPKPLFHETYISIADLAVAVMPRYDLAADRWLFRYLTQTLDRRMLAMLRRGHERVTATAFSLNLNVATVLSPEFLEFDAGLRTGARGSIVIELDKTDIYSDIGAYLFARDFARERGYRICLDGATDLTLPFIDRERLGLDLVKMFWSSDMLEVGRSARADSLRDSIERVGRGRLILARCDSEAAVRFGLGLGIATFQGRFIDRLPSLRAGAEAAAAASRHDRDRRHHHSAALQAQLSSGVRLAPLPLARARSKVPRFPLPDAGPAAYEGRHGRSGSDLPGGEIADDAPPLRGRRHARSLRLRRRGAAVAGGADPGAAGGAGDPYPRRRRQRAAQSPGSRA